MWRRTLGVCGLLGAAALAQAQPVVFAPLAPAETEAEQRAVRTSPSLRIGHSAHTIAYHILLRSGDRLGGHTFGMLVDQRGKPLGRVSHRPDFTSLIPAGDALFSLTHFEERPGAVYLTELAQDPEHGYLQARSTRPLDLSGVGGIYAPCAGSVTPWYSHLGGEEYEPDARAFEAAVEHDSAIEGSFRAMARYFDVDPKQASTEELAEVLQPYRYGFVTEITLDNSADQVAVEVEKHYAMGRASIEVARVMPDGRSVYISDDASNGGLYLFVADNPGDLSAGRLFAMAWRQKTSRPPTADLEWVDLGHASDGDIEEAIDQGGTFSDLFSVRDPDHCPSRYRLINTRFGRECLRLRRGMGELASRLETRRYAALQGATTEWRKAEGLTVDTAAKQLFLASSEHAQGMLDGQSPFDDDGRNDMRIAANPCGGVWQFALGWDEAVGSGWVAQSARTALVGVAAGEGRNQCAVDAIANPDNLAAIDGHHTVLIAEDSGRGHQNDALWAYDWRQRRLTRVQTSPFGAEITSPYVYPNLNGRAYITSVIQHPYAESDRDRLRPGSGDERAYVGYIGPLPALAVEGDHP